MIVHGASTQAIGANGPERRLYKLAFGKFVKFPILKAALVAKRFLPANDLTASFCATDCTLTSAAQAISAKGRSRLGDDEDLCRPG